jgi:hypothetical protein
MTTKPRTEQSSKEVTTMLAAWKRDIAAAATAFNAAVHDAALAVSLPDGDLGYRRWIATHPAQDRRPSLLRRSYS